eukprot:TRINITY_DN900_c0_g1_i3.p2 TRINITY_DN900_c0_g1~~TRINITY_DN900_c0_g1_i3.p2  ORF type:complete len:291 (+),score=55.55 TRINITY_DN900_c0_g1_i3:1496-2368(+)
MAASSSTQGRIEEILKGLWEKHPGGITQIMINEAFQGVIELKSVAEVMNAFLRQGKMTLHKHPDGSLVYVEVNEEEQLKFRGLAAEELQTYQIIQNVGEEGIWLKKLKTLTNIAQMQLAKILKSLESRKLIKELTISKKKMYFLFNVEPSKQVVGNIFSDPTTGFDKHLIDTLSSAIERFLDPKTTGVSAPEILTYLNHSGVLKEDIEEKEILQLLNTMIYDRKIIDKQDTKAGSSFRKNVLYYKERLPLSLPGISTVPCFKCPVFNECTVGGEISPEKCVYYTNWLNEF